MRTESELQLGEKTIPDNKDATVLSLDYVSGKTFATGCGIIFYVDIVYSSQQTGKNNEGRVHNVWTRLRLSWKNHSILSRKDFL